MTRHNVPLGRRDNQVIGMLSREDVITFLHTLQELGTSPTHKE
jgi:hypothetical protein